MKNLELRNFEDKDLDTLYIHMTDCKSQKLTSFHYRVNSKDEFAQRFRNDLRSVYNDFFMIYLEGEAIGYVYSYELHILDGHLKVTLCIFPEHTGHGLGPLAGLQMLKYLFEFYPIHEVFTSVFSYNDASLKMHSTFGFKEVGRLPRYRYYDGVYHDQVIYVITREDYEKFLQRNKVT